MNCEQDATSYVHAMIIWDGAEYNETTVSS